MHEQIGEIEIRKHLDLTNDPRQLVDGSVIPPENIITAAEVVRAVDDLRARGVRTLLLTVDMMSGHVLAGLQVLHALREFQRAGGTIVASVPKWAGSMLVPIALIADLVIVGEEAKFYIHSAWGPEDGEGEPGESTRACNDHMLRFILNRTWTPRAELERCLSQRWNPVTRKFEVIQIPARQAVQLGWADDVGGPEVARFVAEKLAAGVPVTSRRREVLAQRPPPPVFEGFNHPAYVRALGSITANLGTVTAGVIEVTDNMYIGTERITVLTQATNVTPAAGWTGTVRVGKSFKTVCGTVWVTASNASTAAWDAIAFLPAALRPPFAVAAVGTIYDSSASSKRLANFEILSDGTIYVTGWNTTGANLGTPPAIGLNDQAIVSFSFVQD